MWGDRGAELTVILGLRELQVRHW